MPARGADISFFQNGPELGRSGHASQGAGGEGSDLEVGQLMNKQTDEEVWGHGAEAGWPT
jgi:hypothetical protein